LAPDDPVARARALLRRLLGLHSTPSTGSWCPTSEADDSSVLGDSSFEGRRTAGGSWTDTEESLMTFGFGLGPIHVSPDETRKERVVPAAHPARRGAPPRAREGVGCWASWSGLGFLA